MAPHHQVGASTECCVEVAAPRPPPAVQPWQPWPLGAGATCRLLREQMSSSEAAAGCQPGDDDASCSVLPLGAGCEASTSDASAGAAGGGPPRRRCWSHCVCACCWLHRCPQNLQQSHDDLGRRVISIRIISRVERIEATACCWCGQCPQTEQEDACLAILDSDDMSRENQRKQSLSCQAACGLV